jgi:hypothetical protein
VKALSVELRRWTRRILLVMPITFVGAWLLGMGIGTGIYWNNVGRLPSVAVWLAIGGYAAGGATVAENLAMVLTIFITLATLPAMVLKLVSSASPEQLFRKAAAGYSSSSNWSPWLAALVAAGLGTLLTPHKRRAVNKCIETPVDIGLNDELIG